MKRHQMQLLSERFAGLNMVGTLCAQETILDAGYGHTQKNIRYIVRQTILYAPAIYLILNIEWSTYWLSGLASYALISYIALHFLLVQFFEFFNWKQLKKQARKGDLHFNKLEKYSTDSKKVQWSLDFLAVALTIASTYLLYTVPTVAILVLNIIWLPFIVLALYVGVTTAYKVQFILYMSENIMKLKGEIEIF